MFYLVTPLICSLSFLIGGYKYFHMWKPCNLAPLESLQAQPDYVSHFTFMCSSTTFILHTSFHFYIKIKLAKKKHAVRIHVAIAQWLRASNIFRQLCQHPSGAGSSPAGSVGRDFNLQKLNYQYLTTSVAVVLVVR